MNETASSERSYWGPKITEGEVLTSASIGELVAALALAQLEYKAVIKGSDNPYFKSRYADLAAVIEGTQEALARQGLALMQWPIVKGEEAGVDNLLCHKSGQWMSTRLLLPMVKVDAQGIGSAITYARRYAYQSILGIAGEDDDGTAAVSSDRKGQPQQPPIQEPKRTSEQTASASKPNGPVELISEKQVKLFFATMRGPEYPAKPALWTEEEAKELILRYGFKHTKDITRDVFDSILADLRSRQDKEAK